MDKYAKGLETKRKIVDCAVDLFIKNGFRQTTIKDICQVSGIAVGTFYHHFKSKKDILIHELSVFDGFYEELEVELAKETPFDQIVALFDATMIKLMDYEKEFVGVVYSNYLDGNTKVFSARTRPLYQIVHRMFESGIDSGQFIGNYDAWELTDRLIMNVHGTIYHWLSLKTDKSIKDYCHTEVTFFLERLLKE